MSARTVFRGAANRTVARVGGASGDDVVAVEEPLEIRVDGDVVAITMRTPGDDELLALGFLASEGIVREAGDVSAIRACGRPGEPGYGNVIDVISAPGAPLAIERVEAARRGTLTTAACGVCGRRTIDDLLALAGVVDDETTFAPGAISAMVARLGEAQPIFARTGGLHAAAIFDREGAALAVYEDVGRHNAVDKAVGKVMRDHPRAAKGRVLAVSGRASYEIVHKAVVARIALIASVSAASTLAIDVAERCGVTLAAFVRDGRMNVYTGARRLGL